MEVLKKTNYLKVFTYLFILIGISFSLISLSVFHIEQTSLEKEIFKAKAKDEISLHQTEFISHIDYLKDIIYGVSQNRFIKEYLKNPNMQNYKNVTELFYTISSINKNIMQLRYIDENGFEKIRLDRDTKESPIKLIEGKKLQDKSKRDYFIDANNKKENEFYISKLDLNIENGKIETPYNPVIRFAISVFTEKKRKGIIIINIFMKEILDKIVSSSNFYTYVYDNKNYLLYSNDNKQKNWQQYLEKKSIFTTTKLFYFEKLFSDEKESLFIGMSIKSSNSWLNQFIKNSVIILLLIVIPAAFIIAYFLSKIPLYLFNKLEEQQKMLIYQSKLAAIGEMIGAIAHQWRQPINAVGVLAQEIQLKFQIGKLDAKEMNSLTEELETNLEYMSKTIDDFRNFFSPSKEKSLFNIVKSIKSTLKIIHKQFENHNIEVEIKPEDENFEYLVYSYESEFKQVIINILNNAKEAMDEYFPKNSLEIKKVSIDISKNDQNIIIKIRDNGGGIKEDILEKIFEAYTTTKQERQGMGIGLYMSQIIIEEHMEGKISAKNIDNGAEFEIKVPMVTKDI